MNEPLNKSALRQCKKFIDVKKYEQVSYMKPEDLGSLPECLPRLDQLGKF